MARSPLMRTGKYKSVRLVPLPIHSSGFCGSLKAINPASERGFILIIFQLK